MAVAEEQLLAYLLASFAASRPSIGSHYLAKCVLRGSNVLHVAYGHLRSPSSYEVVFGKETSIELVVIGDDGTVQSICEQAVFGTIKDIAVLPWNDNINLQNPQMQEKDLLVVISDSGKLSFLSFCNEMHRFFPVAHAQLSNPGNSRNQLGRMLAVDSSGSFIAVSAYEDRIALFSLSMRSGSNIIDKKIIYPPECEGDATASRKVQRTSITGTIWSMCFISKDASKLNKDHNPVLAIILNRRKSLLNDLLLLEWDVRDQTISVLSKYIEGGPLAQHIVEVPNASGFAFLFRVGDALLMDLRDAQNPRCVYRTSLNFVPHPLEDHYYVEDSCRVHDADDERLFRVAACALLELRDYDPMCIDGDNNNVKCKHVCSWSWEPKNDKSSKLVLCLDTGEFLMIEIFFESSGLKVGLSECLYKGQPCKALLWVEGGYLAALVEMGDGVVLKVQDGTLLYVSPIQNISPILDMSIVDYHDEKREQIFACCGVAPEGSLRIIRSGISIEKLLKTASIYLGITGTWTIKMKLKDVCHSFLVLSFVEETRVLSVGLSFSDVTDSVGFQPHVCTLACGIVDDGLLVQIHQKAVKLCLPTKMAHHDGIPLSSPVCTCWYPENLSISLGAVAHNMIVVSTSNPCILFILGVRLLSAWHYEIYVMQHLSLQSELSCISIAPKCLEDRSSFPFSQVSNTLPAGVDIGYTFVIGTHRPSVEVLSFAVHEGLRVLASGSISLMNTTGTAISGCIPQDVRLVAANQCYVLTGLRNGMLLRFEWPPACNTSTSGVLSHTSCNASIGNPNTVLSTTRATNFSGSQTSAVSLSENNIAGLPVNLQLIATRRIGITPVFLVPLSDSLDADIIALCDRPWLVHSARHSLAYTSISFQPSTHATPVCSVECPKGILFVSENCLNLVEMVNSKRLNVQKFHIGGTPRKVLYHSESRLLVVMRTELNNDSCSSDICCVDPLSGSVVSVYKLDPGETGKCMELVRAGNEQVLVVGTSLSSGPAIMSSGEAESTKGRLIVLCIEHVQNSDSGSMTFSSKLGSSSQKTSPFREIVGYATEQLSNSSLCSSPDDASCDGLKLEDTEAWQLRSAYSMTWPGMVLAICPYLDRYFLASAGNAFYVCGFPNDNPQRVRRFAVGRTRFMIMLLTTHFSRIAVGDCRDGILFFSYNEDSRKLEQLYCDPSQRLVADCILMDSDRAVVSDRKGSIAVLSSSGRLVDNASPECNLTLSCAYHLGEIAMSIRKGSFIYKLPADEDFGDSDFPSANFNTSNDIIIAGTLLGSIVILVPLSREEYNLLDVVQHRLAVHPLTAPVLGNDHNEFRSRENPVGSPKMLDGDLLAQFLELTNIQQEAVLAWPSNLKRQTSFPISVNKVVQLLERVHYALN